MSNLKRHDENILSQHFAKLGRKGGKARAATMTPEARSAIGRKASAAAAAKRSAKKSA